MTKPTAARTVANTFNDMLRVIEVQNALILQITRSLVEALAKLGLYEEVDKLGGQLRIAAAVMTAGVEEFNARKAEEEE